MKKLRSLTVVLLANCMVFFSYAQIPSSFAFRPAIILIGGIKSTIETLEKEIDQLELRAIGVASLKEELQEVKDELKKTKARFNITSLEERKKQIKEQFDTFAQRFFKKAKDKEGKFLYYSVNEMMTKILNDQEVLRKLRQIMRLQEDIKERIQFMVDKIQNVGSEISNITQAEQRALIAQKTQLAIIQQQLTVQALTQAVSDEVEPLAQKIINLKEQINKTLAQRLSGDTLNLIEQYKNRIRQYQILLEMLRDPAIIPLITEDEVLGIK